MTDDTIPIDELEELGEQWLQEVVLSANDVEVQAMNTQIIKCHDDLQKLIAEHQE